MSDKKKQPKKVSKKYIDETRKSPNYKNPPPPPPKTEKKDED